MGGDSYANFNSLPAVETTAHSHCANVQTNKSGRRSPCGNRSNYSAIAASETKSSSLFSTTCAPTSPFTTATTALTRNSQAALLDAGQAVKFDKMYARTFAPRAPRIERVNQCDPRTATPSQSTPCEQKRNPHVRSSLVKTERLSSDPSDEGCIGEDVATADCGYTSSSTTTEEGSTSSEVSPTFLAQDFVSPCHASEHEQPAVFDKDDEAACDDLLMDILSGDGDGGVHGDGFLSLLTDDGASTASGGGSGSNASFVKEEMYC